MIPLTEPELLWGVRETAPAKLDMDERLLRAGVVQCPGAYARGCLALIPAGSGFLLCQFCRGTIRLNTTRLGR